MEPSPTAESSEPEPSPEPEPGPEPGSDPSPEPEARSVPWRFWDIILALVLGFVLSRTNFGFLVRAFGANNESTRLSGVNTPHVVLGAFLITAFAAMVAGFVLAAFSNTAVSSMSDGYDFRALAAIILGGTSVFGGRGSVLRTVLGVIFVSVLTNVLVLSGFGYGWQQVAIGSLIVLAVSVDALARRMSRK